MGWVYILVRTYPFWAVPTGALMLMATLGKRGKKIPGKQRLLYIVTGVAFIASAVLFFVFGGPMNAVPLVHDTIRESQGKP